MLGCGGIEPQSLGRRPQGCSQISRYSRSALCGIIFGAFSLVGYGLWTDTHQVARSFLEKTESTNLLTFCYEHLQWLWLKILCTILGMQQKTYHMSFGPIILSHTRKDVTHHIGPTNTLFWSFWSTGHCNTCSCCLNKSVWSVPRLHLSRGRC